MGRRKRIHSEDYDDSLEQRFFSKQRKLNHNENGDGNGNNNNETNTTKPSSSQHLSPQERELKRQKKKAKKLRQKEKKLAALKAEEKEKDKEHKRISVAVAVAAEKEKEKEKDENKTSTKKKKKKKQIQDKHPNESSTTSSSSSTTTTGKWITINKGVKYCDFLLGKGPMIQDRTQIRVKYTLRAHNKQGKIIDAGANFGFKFGKGEVIVGWELGLKGMKQGGIRHIIVPPNAGYGTRDIGGGSGAMLYFEVTLLKC